MLKHNLFGSFLREKRQKENISLRALFDKAGVTHPYIARIENGSKLLPSDNVLLRHAKGFNLDTENVQYVFLTYTLKFN